MPEQGIRIGVLALQGSFREHLQCLARVGVAAVEVRRSEHLAGLSGLVIPGGESTTMALVAERWGLVRSPASCATFRLSLSQISALREFAASGRPIWGTCAGLIFLADEALGEWPAAPPGDTSHPPLTALRSEAGRPATHRRPGRGREPQLFRQPG